MPGATRTTIQQSPTATQTIITNDQIIVVISEAESALGHSREHLITTPGGQSDHQLFRSPDGSFRSVQTLAHNDHHSVLVRGEQQPGSGTSEVQVIMENGNVGNRIEHDAAGTLHQLTHFPDIPPDGLFL